MWVGHFEELGTPSENIQFDSAFLTRVTANVQEIFTSCTDDPQEHWVDLFNMRRLHGTLIDYEHVRFAGPDLRILL